MIVSHRALYSGLSGGGALKWCVSMKNLVINPLDKIEL
jgi:hypothetical protein